MIRGREERGEGRKGGRYLFFYYVLQSNEVPIVDKERIESSFCCEVVEKLASIFRISPIRHYT